VLRRIYGPKKDKVIVRIEKTTQRGNYWTVLLAAYCSYDQIEKNEMGGTCNTYFGEEYTGFW
jgi:hypothetical protein